MARVAIRFNRSRRVLVNAPEVRKELEKALEDPIKPRYIKEFKKRVTGWRGKPDFQARKRITADYIALDVFPQGDNADRWTWISRGTKRRDITPKRGMYLTFRLGYVSKTGPNDGWYGGPGRAVGEWRRVSIVKNHEIKARHWEESISKKEKPWFENQIENAFKRGIRRMQRG